jgi:endonuclease/exonuclease/phosphatase family metal-dependent hydrolase
MAGLGVLSRYPIRQWRLHLLQNPELRAVHDGVEMLSHDKGVLVCTLIIPNGSIDVASLHVFPFHRFGRTAQDAEFGRVWTSLADGANHSSTRSIVLAGDFNTPQRTLALRALHRPFVSAVGDRPTHNGQSIDDILYSSDLSPVRPVEVVPTFSDHHFCVAELALPRSG